MAVSRNLQQCCTKQWKLMNRARDAARADKVIRIKLCPMKCENLKVSHNHSFVKLHVFQRIITPRMKGERLVELKLHKYVIAGSKQMTN